DYYCCSYATSNTFIF
nr:immunoglobulin light chain junction region [Macaca mulatta]MOX80752.1 immunoglobulin light chain junction region [Macaca mulatta]